MQPGLVTKIIPTIYLQNQDDTFRASRIMNQAGIKSSYLSSRFNMITYSYKLYNNIQYMPFTKNLLFTTNKLYKGTAAMGRFIFE